MLHFAPLFECFPAERLNRPAFLCIFLVSYLFHFSWFPRFILLITFLSFILHSLLIHSSIFIIYYSFNLHSLTFTSLIFTSPHLYYFIQRAAAKEEASTAEVEMKYVNHTFRANNPYFCVKALRARRGGNDFGPPGAALRLRREQRRGREGYGAVEGKIATSVVARRDKRVVQS